jgi:UDP-N-acetylglucosamine acyltransferase
MTNLAYVHPEAKIGNNVTIEPFAYIAANVEIGDDCWIGPHAVILDNVKMGKGCKVFPGAVIGAIPQDLKFHGEETYVEIGDNTTIRECATINRGTEASGKRLTKVGSNCLIMSYAHIAHDCVVGDNCIIVSHVGIAGETDIDDWAIIGGGTMAHQFSKIGVHAMVGGASAVNKDVPPYVLAARNPLAFEGINVVGLRRRGFTADDIDEIKRIYSFIYDSKYNVSDACDMIRATFPDSRHAKVILDFITSSKRGIVR